MREFQFLFLDSLPFWENERARIASGDLNYERTIKRELLRLQKVREDFMIRCVHHQISLSANETQDFPLPTKSRFQS